MGDCLTVVALDRQAFGRYGLAVCGQVVISARNLLDPGVILIRPEPFTSRPNFLPFKLTALAQAIRGGRGFRGFKAANINDVEVSAA